MLIGLSWCDFSLALVLFGLYECVGNNSLKPYRREIIRPCYSDGHYRSTTCIASSPLIAQNGCWGAHQESCFVNCILECVRLCKLPNNISICVWGLLLLCPNACTHSVCMRVCFNVAGSMRVNVLMGVHEYLYVVYKGVCARM